MSENKPKYGNKKPPTEIELLQMRFIQCLSDYIELFEEKEEMPFNGFIGQEWGGICEFSDFTFHFDDIRYTIDNNLPKGLIIEWYYADLEYNQNKEVQDHIHINLPSYHKGLRYETLNK